jgi:hypothetical protein
MNTRPSLIMSMLIIPLMLMASLNSALGEPLLKPTFNKLFQPLLADPMEPRIAVMPWTGKRYLQLDIGSSADLWQNDQRTLAAGIDFGTWSLLHRADNFKFPVDAIDYLFGANVSMRQPIEMKALPFNEFNARLRLSHISAHFEDGHYDKVSQSWNTGDSPFPIPFTYSREFLNLVTGLSSPGKRIYLGYQYMFHTLPGGISPHSLQAGAEIGTSNDTYLAADFKLLPIWQNDLAESRGYRGTWDLQAGVRLRAIGLDQVRIACNYFSGMSRQGMYFYRPESYTTLGMIIDL